MEHPWTTQRDACPLVNCSHRSILPRVIEVSRQDCRAALDNVSLVSMLRAQLKETSIASGDYIYRCVMVGRC